MKTERGVGSTFSFTLSAGTLPASAVQAVPGSDDAGENIEPQTLVARKGAPSIGSSLELA